MISKTKISKRIKKKTNLALANAIFLAKKSGNLVLAGALSSPARKQPEVNVGKLNDSKKETVIVPGKVLSSGNIKSGRKIKVYALKFSEKAEKKLKDAGCACEILIKALEKGEKINGEIIK